MVAADGSQSFREVINRRVDDIGVCVHFPRWLSTRLRISGSFELRETPSITDFHVGIETLTSGRHRNCRSKQVAYKMVIVFCARPEIDTEDSATKIIMSNLSPRSKEGRSVT